MVLMYSYVFAYMSTKFPGSLRPAHATSFSTSASWMGRVQDYLTVTVLQPASYQLMMGWIYTGVDTGGVLRVL